ncbi:MAG: hypothetical protein KBB52_06035 [Candidatus Omnitrophica bacterium]|nr:hypothetical protein [Candidatus Omnitrophota bacterium]
MKAIVTRSPIRPKVKDIAFVRLKIAGKSMNPLLCDGAFVNAVLCTAGNIRVGDIAVFKNTAFTNPPEEDPVTAPVPHRFICHRVIQIINKDGRIFFKTKGDSSISVDPMVSTDLLIGKVTLLKGKYLSLPLDNILGRMIGLGLGFIYPVACRLVYMTKKMLGQG